MAYPSVHENSRLGTLQGFHEDNLRVLLENMVDFLLEVDSERRVLFISRCAEGYSQEQVLGVDLLEWIEPDQRHMVRSCIETTFRDAQSTSYRVMTSSQYAAPRWYAATVSPIVRDGLVSTAVIVSRDITEQKKAEDALAASEARWRTLVENMPDFAVLVDPAGDILYANRTVSNVTLEQVIGKSVYDFAGPHDASEMRAALEASLRSGNTETFTIRTRMPSGETRWFTGRVAPVPFAPDIQALLILANDVTERLQAETELAESEARLRQVIDLVPHMIFARNLHGQFLLANQATAEAYSTTVAELKGKPTATFHRNQEELELYLADDRQVHESQLSSFYPRKQFTGVDGVRRILQTHKIPFTLRGSEEPLVLGVAIDVTEQEQAREALQASEEQFRSLVENINDVIFTQDRDGILSYVSPVVERLGLYTPSEIVGHSFAEFVHPDDLEGVLRSREKTLRGEYDPAEFRVHAKDGSIHYVRTSSRLLWENGEIIGLTGVLTDVTERRRAEEALRASEERYRSIYNLAPLVIVVSSHDGVILDWNRRAEELFGWTRTEVLGKRFCDFAVPPDARKAIRAIVRDTLAGKHSWSVNENLTRDGRTIICEWNNSLREDPEGGPPAILSVAIDVTERHLEEARRRKLEEQIQHTQKLESLGVLAGGIAHDFNNLLVGILGNADFALQDLPRNSPIAEHLHDVVTAAHRAADLCRQLLAYSGKGRFVVLPLDLRDVVHEMTQLLELTIARKARLELNFSEVLPAVEADPTQIRQIVMNLVSNAAESFENRMGCIRLTIGEMYCEGEFFRGTYLRESLPEGNYVFLSVTDDGCGMDHETQQRLFEPFYTTKFAGRGLGLAAVLGIVRSHGGGIKVYSEPERGTNITVYLPASNQHAEATQLHKPDTEHWRGDGLVLVVDDEEPVVSTSRKMLERAGLSVITALDGLQGLQLFEEHRHLLKLVLLDLTMPLLSGQEVLKRMRQMAPEIPVLLASGYNEEEALGQFSDEMPHGFLQKPYSQREFLQKVRAAVERPAS